MPVSAEDASFATSSLSLFYVPINKFFAIIVMNTTIALQSKMNVCEYRSFFKQE
jgi:hypothetical protein